MVSLLDVNLLVALAWPSHVHHRPALAWFRENQSRGWATCPLTQSGFVRVSANPQVLSEAKTVREAVQLLQRIVLLPHHQFWLDDVSIAASPGFDTTRVTGYRQITDAHLLALALHRGGRLATFDRKIAALAPAGASADVVSLIAAV